MTRLIDQKGRDRHRPAHPFDPRLELSVFCRSGAVHDLPHGHIRHRIHKTGGHHQEPYHRGRHSHHIRVEFQHKGGGQDEGKIISEISEHISQLILHTKWLHSRIFILHNFSPFLANDRFSVHFLYSVQNIGNEQKIDRLREKGKSYGE